VHRSRLVLTVVLLGTLCLAPAPSEAQWRLTSCSTTGQNLFVRDVMTDLYLWYRQMPQVNPTSFASPEAYLEAVRYRELDSSFSYIGARAAEEAFYSDSQYIGFGFSQYYNGADLRVAQVFPESPASEAGLSRGDVFVEIDGRTIPTLAEAGLLGSAFGPSQEGYEVEVVCRRAGGELVRVRMAKRVITIPTVTLAQVYTLEDGRRVGYVFFRNFVEPSVEALNQAFAQLRAAEVNDLVLDLRYNGGGLVAVAKHLASLIGGTRTNGQLLAVYQHNDKNEFRNVDIRFEEKEQALQLDRLIVITTKSTASASELIINALRPFIPVITIGEATYGKPVGMYGITFCDKVLYPVAFSLRNANNEGDYFGGFPPTCVAPDDFEHQLGDVAEGSLAEAFRFAQTGECTPPPVEATTAQARRARLPRSTGFQALVNAY
jgi:C-terminal processing protease CtpA/Prc